MIRYLKQYKFLLFLTVLFTAILCVYRYLVATGYGHCRYGRYGQLHQNTTLFFSLLCAYGSIYVPTIFVQQKICLQDYESCPFQNLYGNCETHD